MFKMEKKNMPLLGWLGIAIFLIAALCVFMLSGCSLFQDKKIEARFIIKGENKQIANVVSRNIVSDTTVSELYSGLTKVGEPITPDNFKIFLMTMCLSSSETKRTIRISPLGTPENNYKEQVVNFSNGAVPTEISEYDLVEPGEYDSLTIMLSEDKSMNNSMFGPSEVSFSGMTKTFDSLFVVEESSLYSRDYFFVMSSLYSDSKYVDDIGLTSLKDIALLDNTSGVQISDVSGAFIIPINKIVIPEGTTKATFEITLNINGIIQKYSDSKGVEKYLFVDKYWERFSLNVITE